MTGSLGSNPDSSLIKAQARMKTSMTHQQNYKDMLKTNKQIFKSARSTLMGTRRHRNMADEPGTWNLTEPIKEWESNLQEGTLKPGRKHPSQPSISTWGQRPLRQRKADCSVENGCASGHLGAGRGTLSSGGCSDSRETGSEILHRQDLSTLQVTDYLDHERC